MTLKRSLLILTALVFLLLSGYVALWYFVAAKVAANFESLLFDISSEIYEEGGEFSYERVETSGFPGNIITRIYRPRYLSYDTSSYEIETKGTITVVNDLFGNRFWVKLPKSLKFTTGNEALPPMAINFFGKGASFYIRIDQDHLLPWVFSGYDNNVNNFSATIGKFKYSDTGFVLTNAETSEILAKADSNFVVIESRKDVYADEIFDIELEIKNFKHDRLFSLLGNDKLCGKSNYFLKVRYDDLTSAQKMKKIALDKLTFACDDFSFAANGNIVDQFGDFPYGNLTIKSSNLDGLVDYETESLKFLNKLFDLEEPNLNFTNNEIKALKDILRKINEAKVEEEGDDAFLLTLRREQKSDLLLGEYSLQDVVKLYENSKNVKLRPRREERQDSKPASIYNNPTVNRVRTD